jgi:hypothetical protein
MIARPFETPASSGYSVREGPRLIGYLRTDAEGRFYFENYSALTLAQVIELSCLMEKLERKAAGEPARS